MNNFKVTIGIECHIALNTKTKMFSNSVSKHNDLINKNINEVDLGLPGSLPSVNEMAVFKALMLAKALKMNVKNYLIFDRKNYFYQDLPKGFQITQQYFPIATNGEIIISNNKKIVIERIHLEEDTAKQQVIDNQIYLDYNRAGVPLIEIVTKPVIHSAKEAYEYLVELKRILTFLDISDAKMEEGSLRADINISLNLHGEAKLGTKVEIKNINSFNNIMKAINYEIDRQEKLILTNQKVNQETRRWDDQTKTTIFMRLKTDAVDYHYFCEPNIIKLDIPKRLFDNVNNSNKTLPSELKKQMLDSNIDINIINQLLDNYELYCLFNEVYQSINNLSFAITWIIVELQAILKKQNLTLKDIKKSFIKNLISMYQLLEEQKINAKQAKIIFEKMFVEDIEPVMLIKKLGFEQITDENILTNLLLKYLEENKVMLKDYENRCERVEKFFIGLLMRDTKGQANPVISMRILKQLITKLIKNN